MLSEAERELLIKTHHVKMTAEIFGVNERTVYFTSLITIQNLYHDNKIK